MKTARGKSVLSQSSIAFLGKVMKTHAATLDMVTPSSQTAVVRVDEVLKGPKAFYAYREKTITVRLLKAGSVKPDQHIVFCANGWLYGKGIAVVETGSFTGNVGRIRKQIRENEDDASLKALRERVVSAGLVVSGSVVQLREAKELTQTRVLSEHNPLLWQAVVRIDKVLRGRHRGKTVTVTFPTSKDVQWRDKPRLEAGQEGVWLLRRGETPTLAKSLYTALDPLDAQPRDREALIAEYAG